jgi:hypothetical protein
MEDQEGHVDVAAVAGGVPALLRVDHRL